MKHILRYDMTAIALVHPKKSILIKISKIEKE